MNRKASMTAVPEYEHPAAKFGRGGWAMANYSTVVSSDGAMTPLGLWNTATLIDVSKADGTGCTIMVVETKEAVPWAKPEPLMLTAGKPVPKVGGLAPGRFNLAMTDATVHYIRDGIKPAFMRRLYLADDGLIIPKSVFK